MSILLDGTVDYSIRTEQDVIGLGLDVDELGARGGVWKLSRSLTGPTTSLNERDFRLEPGVYAAVINPSTLLGCQYHEPIVRFEVVYSDKLSASRKSKSDRIFRVIPPPLDSDLLWPNQRINNFMDLVTLRDWRNRSELLQENKTVKPSATLRIRNDGMLQRELFGGARAGARGQAGSAQGHR